MNSKPVIRVGGVPEHFNLLWHQTIAQDGFSGLDIEIKFIEYPGGTGAMTSAMSEGELDVALLLFEGAATNILRGHPNRIVKVYVQSPLIWGIHVAAESQIRTIDEVQNKIYAISRAGSGSHLIAIVDAAERGWPIDGMKFSKVGNLAGAREKLASGKVDVFFWERFTTQPFVDSGEFRRVGQREVPWPAFVVSVRKEILKTHAADIRQMLEIIDESCTAFKEDGKAVQTVSDTFDIKLEDSAAWFKQVEWNRGFDRPDQTIEKLIGYLQKVKLIDSTSVSPEDIWHRL